MTTAFNPSKIRNIAVMAHGGAGKSTLLDSLLALAQEIIQRDESRPTMLTEPEEKAHHHAITPHFGHLNWQGHIINIIDTPGYFSFLETGRGVLPGVDGAVLIVSGIDGVHPETERLWSMLRDNEIPTIVFVNMMDLEESDFPLAMASIRERLGVEAHAITIPIRGGFGHVGAVDLIRKNAWTFKDGATLPMDIPNEFTGDLMALRTELVERIVESDESLLNRYLAGESLGAPAIEAKLRTLVLNRAFVPVMAGAGNCSIGLEPLLDAIISFLPSPLNRDETRPFEGSGPKKELRACAPDGNFSAVVLKTSVDAYSGKLSVIRVASGTVKANEQILNSTQAEKIRTGHLYLMQGRDLKEVEALSAGQIGAISKLGETRTGDTLSSTENPIVFPRTEYPTASFVYAVKGMDKISEDKIALGLHELAEEDPTLRIERDEETHEMLLAGMGQSHLDIALERLTRKYGCKARLSTPRVPFRETLRRSVRVQGRLKKQNGGRGQFADCWLEVSPLPRNSGFIFEDAIAGGAIPKQFVPSVKKGVLSALTKGLLSGHPVTDVKVRLVDGSFHDVDSSDMAFQTAGSLGFRRAMEESGMHLLEPIMSLDVIVPEESLGSVLKELASRRGRIINVDARGNLREISAEAPMTELADFGPDLSSMTSGRGTYTMMVLSYREVPEQIGGKFLKDMHLTPASA